MNTNTLPKIRSIVANVARALTVNREEYQQPQLKQDRTEEIFGEPIYSYSREQAMADGYLVDLMQPGTAGLVREAGFKYPMAMTIGAFASTVSQIDKPLPEGQDVSGRLWDVLWMLHVAITAQSGQPTERVPFTVSVWNGRRRELVKLWAQCGPGDDASPVITIMLEGED